MAQSPELCQSNQGRQAVSCGAAQGRQRARLGRRRDEEAREDLADDGSRRSQLVRLEEHDVVTHVTRRLVGRATDGDRTWRVLFALRCSVVRW